MKKNKLNGVKPFNELFYRSCYYHQLIAALGIFGLDGKDILLNEFVTFGEDLTIASERLVSEKELAKKLGFAQRRVKRFTQKRLVRCIDGGRPLLVGADCYYLPDRMDTYKKLHGAHFILVYGYDLERQVVNIVDHNYVNSFLYEEKIMSLGDLLHANTMVRKIMTGSKKSCFILRRRKRKKPIDFLQTILGDKDGLSGSRASMERNLAALKELFRTGAPALEERYDDIVRYLTVCRDSRQRIANTRIADIAPVLSKTAKELVSEYSYLLALFWKMYYTHDFSSFSGSEDKIFRKIDHIAENENTIFAALLAGGKEERA